MNEVTVKEKQEIREIVNTAKILARCDPQSLKLAKFGMDLLKARCEIDEPPSTPSPPEKKPA
ncbi:hypothetical protein [Anaeromassilibacillus senegalensis]|uniref:hypothetical protein n=1 Tax=Anaeromassilibacillus senegalensis TaxID=1673717 RepID=UPI000682EE0A|nr:hypothetical protein [Anaeromassilibacillus senegalensis]